MKKILLLALMITSAQAQTIDAPQASIRAYAKTPSGSVPFSPESLVKSGDEIEYQVWLNAADERIQSAEVTVQLPDNLALTEQSLYGVKASLDGVNFYAHPIRADLGQGVVEVPVMYYRALRFGFSGIGSQKAKSASFSAKVY